MRAEALVNTERLLAQSVNALADHIINSTAYALMPVVFSDLPTSPAAGMIACISDSTVNTWGAIVVGGGTEHVLAFYNGTNWTVAGA